MNVAHGNYLHAYFPPIPIGLFRVASQNQDGTLNSPISVSHNIVLEPMLVLIMRNNVFHINFQPTLNF